MIGKRLSMLCGIILAVIFLAGFMNDARGADWVQYETSASGDKYFYDRDSVQNVSNDVITVWTKSVFSVTGRALAVRMRRELGLSITGYESLKEDRVLYLINCREEKYKITDTVDYASDGRVLTKAHVVNSSWLKDAEGSMVDELIKAVCKEAKHANRE